MSGKSSPSGPTPRMLVDGGTLRLASAGVENAEYDAMVLFMEAFGMDRVHFTMDKNRPVSGEKAEKGRLVFEEWISLREKRVPLQQILGSTGFMGLTFLVNEHVLVPRFDTEILVEKVLKECPDRNLRVLDICTGSGCIAISLAVLGGYRETFASDISPEALKVAEKNAGKLFLFQKGSAGAKRTVLSEEPRRAEYLTKILPDPKKNPGALPEERRLTFFAGDLFGGVPEGERFAVITANPPYIPTAMMKDLMPEVRDHEPALALDGKEDGLFFYRRIADEGGRYLLPGGRLYLEIGSDQAGAVSELLWDAGFQEIDVTKDLAGNDRVVSAVWK